MERRFTDRSRAPLEIRTRADGVKAIVGYGAVFYSAADAGTEYEMWTDTYERVMPGAFDRALREDDVRSLFNHDPNFILGRVKAGTLALSVDAVGLRYEVVPPDSQAIRDHVLAPIGRGDISGSSFMFVPRDAQWTDSMRGDRKVSIREIKEVELWEVGPVVFPAYESTTTGLRSEDLAEARASHAAWLESLRMADEVAVRRRVVALHAR